MPGQWEVVGGSEKGGILVRKGEGLKSEAEEDRLSTGAIIEELSLKGERLNYKIVTGTGPPTGWVSLKVSGKDLLVKKEGGGKSSDSASSAPAPAAGGGGGPGNGKDVEVDTALKTKIEAAAKIKQEQGALLLYCMKYKMLGNPLPAPKMRILCFHNAGSTESVYTGARTPFVEWAKETKAVEICAFDYPGRDKLLKEEKITSAPRLAEELMAVIHEKMTDGVPYMVWAHSVGTWVAFEFLILARKIGLPMPKAAFLNAFPAPHMPEEMRTWHRNRDLNDAQMREELLNWDKEHFTGMGKVVFDTPGWKDTWEPLMRADFCLFDEYRFAHDGAPKFNFPIHSWHCNGEHYNKASQIEMWRDWTDASFDHQVLNMGHLTCAYKPDLKKEYFEKVTHHMKAYSGL